MIGFLFDRGGGNGGIPAFGITGDFQRSNTSPISSCNKTNLHQNTNKFFKNIKHKASDGIVVTV